MFLLLAAFGILFALIVYYCVLRETSGPARSISPELSSPETEGWEERRYPASTDRASRETGEV
jgi:hypothetical protein